MNWKEEISKLFLARLEEVLDGNETWTRYWDSLGGYWDDVYHLKYKDVEIVVFVYDPSSDMPGFTRWDVFMRDIGDRDNSKMGMRIYPGTIGVCQKIWTLLENSMRNTKSECVTSSALHSCFVDKLYKDIRKQMPQETGMYDETNLNDFDRGALSAYESCLALIKEHLMDEDAETYFWAVDNFIEVY